VRAPIPSPMCADVTYLSRFCVWSAGRGAEYTCPVSDIYRPTSQSNRWPDSDEPAAAPGAAHANEAAAAGRSATVEEEDETEDHEEEEEDAAAGDGAPTKKKRKITKQKK
jgi:hypothetical protein